jgi:rSAM/selenodomain-associated transferase 2
MAAPLGKVAVVRARFQLDKKYLFSSMKIAIVVPVFNESLVLPRLMGDLATLKEDANSDFELVFVDGGSTDNTAALIQAAGLRVVNSAKGRAWQMNEGAAQTAGDVLLFLHADTHLPQNAIKTIASSLVGGICWGRFDVRINGKPWMLGVVARMMNWRSRLTGIATGDQAMFMTRDAFQAIGGFPEQALMEDIEASRRLRKLSRPACISSPVVTSGRRWETRGVWTTIVLMWRLRWAYWRGQSPAQLAELYA